MLFRSGRRTMFINGPLTRFQAGQLYQLIYAHQIILSTLRAWRSLGVVVQQKGALFHY